MAFDVEGIERATVEGVAPAKALEIDGWLVPLDAGAIGRAKSAVPLDHDIGPQALEAIAAAYRAEGLPPAFRIADAPGLAAVRQALSARGFAPAKPTVVEIGDLDRLAAFEPRRADLVPRPDAGWVEVFTGEGFDPVEGRSRVAALARAPGAAYACVREAGRTLSVGVATFGHGWAGIHGLRTAADRRGEGLAGRVLSELARTARARGVTRIFLQVEAGNPARSLYRRCGFAPAWAYDYWV